MQVVSSGQREWRLAEEWGRFLLLGRRLEIFFEGILCLGQAGYSGGGEKKTLKKRDSRSLGDGFWVEGFRSLGKIPERG